MATSVASEAVDQLLANVDEGLRSLRNHSWKQRIKIQRGDSDPAVQLVQVRFDSDGELERVPLTAPEQRKPRGPVRKKLAKKKKGKFQEFLKEATALERRYMRLAPGARSILGSAGKTWTDDGGASRVEAANVVVDGDRLVASLDAKGVPQRVEIETFLKGRPATLEFVYVALRGGEPIIGKSTLRTTYDKKPVEIEKENFDHIRQGG